MKFILSLFRIFFACALTAVFLYVLITIVSVQLIGAFNAGRVHEQSIQNCVPPSSDDIWATSRWQITEF